MENFPLKDYGHKLAAALHVIDRGEEARLRGYAHYSAIRGLPGAGAGCSRKNLKTARRSDSIWIRRPCKVLHPR